MTARNGKGGARTGTAPTTNHQENNMTITDTVPAITDTDRPTASIVTVTPGLARDLLRTNTHNRKLRERAVGDYARDMAAGHWTLNGEAIKVASDGTVLDGQHRLRAVVVAGVDVDMFVIYGLDPATQETMDSGRKRSTGDVMGLRGEENATTLAAVLRRIWAWQQGDFKFKGRQAPTTAECAALLAEHPEIRRSAEVATRVRNMFPHIPQSILGTAHFLLMAIDAEQAPWFFQRIADGADLPLGHPVLALRARVTSERLDTVRLPEDRYMAYLIRTWNAVRAGRDLDRLVHNATSAMPMPK
jgi:hypothetical protein